MIAVVALVVLGPDKLPGAARQIGNVIRQFRKISTGFQQELQNALDEPIEAEARQRGELAVREAKPEGGQRSEQSKPEGGQGSEEAKGESKQVADPPQSSL